MDFQRASTGISGLDLIIDGLRLGDNVVWQVDRIADYAEFAKTFAQKALTNEKRLVYVRFGQHPPLLPSHPKMQVYELDASRGFEYFSSAVRELATQEGVGAYYVFDCLSELLSEWSTDLMISNFFIVTCPYLFELNTIAYFGLLRDEHSYQTIARIRDTTQILLDLYHKDRFYIHPLKVWRRYSPTMFLPHAAAGNAFVPLTNSADVAKLFTGYPQRKLGNAQRKLDYWDHIFLKAAELNSESANGNQAASFKQRQLYEQLLRMLISRDERILTLARQYLTMDDLLQIKSRLIGSGYIGGKAVGLLLARAIILQAKDQDWSNRLEPHDSFYVGSDIYYTYLVENDCWQLRQAQKNATDYYSAALTLKARLANGSFPDMIRDPFLEMLEYFGQSPIIIRSSSLLEDSFGNAFAGKYESVFCANQGNLAERYAALVHAIQTVYASTMNEDALAYRWQRGLADLDEQMALLIQRVSGSQHSSFFFPDLAGVALSHNLYQWNDELKPEAGMLRLVVGLGTRAVNRLDDDYARFVALDRPLLRPDASLEERRTYIQHNVDLLDLSQNDLATVAFQELVTAELIPEPTRYAAPDYQSNPNGEVYWYLDFESLLSQTDFPNLMQQLLQRLQTAYGYPVDTEFTANFQLDGTFNINILQCRPLQIKTNRQRVSIPADIPESEIIFKSRCKFMGGSLELRLRQIVLVVPELYAALTISEKYQVARLIGQLNRLISNADENPAMLLGPGRWGTSTPNLGIPVSFAEINRFMALGELAFETSGFTPDLSYGTHFFHDLVETGIFYLALNESQVKASFNRQLLADRPNQLVKLLPEAAKWQEVVLVTEVNQNEEIWLHADLGTKQVCCWRRISN